MKTQSDISHWMRYTLKGQTHRNLSVPLLIEKALLRKEGTLTSSGAFSAVTGAYTGRSPKDKFIVQDASISDTIDWGPINQPMSPDVFDRLYLKMLNYLKEKEIFIFDGYAGADSSYRLPIRSINEYAWHNLFVQQLFVRPNPSDLEDFTPEFTIISAPDLKADPELDGTHSEAFIAVSLKRRLILIGGTQYAGEMKKSIFSIMNYLLPDRDVFPMHCSANIGSDNKTALFFGLSGTGKTTLSADPERYLIGDDEHGWSKDGIFNIEGGCYAKCIGLSEDKEPQIWNAIRFGAVLENVVLDDYRSPNYDDGSLTENTRAAYPIEHIPGARIPGIGQHPDVIIFLTADAFGVLPPIARLTPEQAMYHFLSGYTSKLAGTERGVTEPEATFSTCFGAPFLPRPAHVYAEMLGKRIEEHNARVYLVNTGWSGGAYGIGKRMDLSYTRAMVKAALNGSLDQANFTPDSIFNLYVPDQCPGVPAELLSPRNTWKDPIAFESQAKDLAHRFQKNFSKFKNVDPAVIQAGPRV
ncbi:phosphoenolpyruvate carboxykinase (ATP) [Marininema halotolerans]|uniref:Phosphoenolpyruvate carboxykinase (ATP) n=1 Tax=Marininema halotolerans TaxID=1155944 RepID=A0A1I6SJU0_9BACL|nr:phosphoenolpyruvate carboxykinase (ATP) [Marininema halotolerans]SFS77154.1 phosphoenolpyruvate carboxykinase (ATP) [Marininema halotolerans]